MGVNKMLYFRLVNSSFRRNMQVYGPYLIATSILVAINYIFAVMSANTSLKNLQTGSVTTSMIHIGMIFVLMITCMFLIYVNRFLWRERSKELGLYEMLGMTSHNVALLIAIEKLYLLLISLFAGLIIGVIFEKLAFLGMKFLLQIPKISQPWIQWSSLGQTTIITIAFFGLLLLIDFFKVQLMSAANMWQVQAEKSKHHGVLFNLIGIFGIVMLVITYYITLTIQPRLTALPKFMMAVVLLVIATYLLFIVGSVMILNWLKKNKNYFYQPRHFIAVSGMRQRMEQNGASLATVCLLCSAVLVIIFTSLSLYMGLNDTVNAYSPADVMMESVQPFARRQRQRIHNSAKRHHAQIEEEHFYQMTLPHYGYWRRSHFVDQGSIEKATSKTDTNIIMMSASQYNHLTDRHVRLKKDEALTYRKNKALKGNIHVFNNHYKARPMKTMTNYYNPDRSTYMTTYLIVDHLPKKMPIIHVWSFNYQLQSNRKRISFEKQLATTPGLVSFNGKTTIKTLLTGLYGGLVFVGILTSLTLAVTTVIVIYFKQISEGYADRDRFVIMQQVGLSEKETTQAIHSQVLMVFMLPVIGAIVNLAFAFPAIRQIMHQLNFYNQVLMIIIAVVVPFVLLLLYLLIYAITTRTYRRIVDD